MTFAQRKSAALAALAATAIWESNYAPPIYQLLWALGAKLPPPHFNGFVANMLITGVFFGTIFGAIMTAGAVFLVRGIAPTWPALAVWFAAIASSAGFLFGLAMAGYYALSARAHRLPRWRALDLA